MLDVAHSLFGGSHQSPAAASETAGGAIVNIVSSSSFQWSPMVKGRRNKISSPDGGIASKRVRRVAPETMNSRRLLRVPR